MSRHHQILVVDDEPTNALLLEKALGKAGYDILVANDGFKAVDIAESALPSLILLDMMMPGRDGIEVCQILKSQEATASIPIIFVTAHSETQKVVEAFAAGGSDYVTKPIRIDEILARVSVHIRLLEAEEALRNKNAQVRDVAKQLAQLNEELGHQARIDRLTGVLNRGAWEECALLEYQRAERHGRDFGLIMLDVDHFKNLNDSLGHAAGDECLRRIARCIVSSCRTIDMIGRYGGEEFIIFAPETDVDGTTALAERIRHAMEKLSIDHPSSPVADHVTICLGVAGHTGEQLEVCIKKADDALYEAKNSGRNRVCVSGGKGLTQRSQNTDTVPVQVPNPLATDTSEAQPSVLIVDDDPTNRLVCARCLASEGYHIREAVDGVTALAEIEREHPDVIIMDVMMPNMDGLECTKQLKEDPRTQDIPIILVSALAHREEILTGLEAGAEEYLAKPVRTAELVVRVRSMMRLRLKHKALVQSYELRGEQTRVLALLFDFCQTLGATGDLQKVFERTVTAAAELTASRRVSLMRPDAEMSYLHIAESVGIEDEIVTSVKVPIGDGIAGQVFETGTPTVINEARDAMCDRTIYDTPFFASIPLISAPVGTSGKVLGVLNVTERFNGRAFEAHELEYIELIAGIAGSAIAGIVSNHQRDSARDAIMVALAKLAEYRDTETGKHLERVTAYCRAIAQQLQSVKSFEHEIDDDYVRELTRSAPLHDIGKVAIPDHILRKPGTHTDEEMELMRTHAQVGADTIQAAIQSAPESVFLEMAGQIALCHHEWFDGSGYPQGLKGNAIPLCARIVAVADVYDALSTKRVYKEAYSHDKTIALIVESSGTQFDPAVVEAFLACERELIQLSVELSDATVGSSQDSLNQSTYIGEVVQAT